LLGWLKGNEKGLDAVLAPGPGVSVAKWVLDLDLSSQPEGQLGEGLASQTQEASGHEADPDACPDEEAQELLVLGGALHPVHAAFHV
jgi:hypothetical protein